MDLSRTPPAANEVEITTFGAGVGECIVIHMGANQWLIIDSFINRETKNPIALDYLSHIGIDPSLVKFVCASHWHDDHVKGISKVYEACTGAQAIISHALSTDEFLELLGFQRQHNNLKVIETGVNEIKSLFEIAEARKAATGNSPIKLAKASQLLYADATAGINLKSMSPSDDECVEALMSFKSLLPEGPGMPKKRLTPIPPNEIATVICVESKNVVLLLGSDLETQESESKGWKAVLRTPLQPSGRSHLFKIPHHGSPTAYHPEVWTEKAHENAHAVLTPFSRSKLPSIEDLRRILSHTTNGFIAGGRTPAKLPTPEARAVEKTVKSAVRRRRILNTKLGMVRVRINRDNGEKVVELSGAAQTVDAAINA